MDKHETTHPHPNYAAVAAILLTLTTISFFLSETFESKWMSVAVVLSIATAKTLLVAMFFMHAKFEKNWLFAMLIPTVFLAIVLVAALLPDIAFLHK